MVHHLYQHTCTRLPAQPAPAYLHNLHQPTCTTCTSPPAVSRGEESHAPAPRPGEGVWRGSLRRAEYPQQRQGQRSAQTKLKQIKPVTDVSQTKTVADIIEQ